MAQPKILVVDDDKEIVGAIKKRLELEGYDVVPAYNGLEALDVLVEQDIQLLIIDIMMPGMDGLSATVKSGRVKIFRSSSCLLRRRRAINLRTFHGGGRLCQQTFPAG